MKDALKVLSVFLVSILMSGCVLTIADEITISKLREMCEKIGSKPHIYRTYGISGDAFVKCINGDELDVKDYKKVTQKGNS